MTLSIWRYAHLALALLSALFLILASVTGVILAVDAVQERTQPYGVANFDELTLANSIPLLKEKFEEVGEISIDHNGFVLLKGFDKDGEEIDSYIDPNNGVILGKPIEKSQFVQWNIALHRSLFLKETGRLIIGVISFLLVLISISGVVLIVKRQRGVKRFFHKVIREYFAQYYHVLTGRLMLIPILVIALTGTYLSMARFKVFPVANIEHKEITARTDEQKQEKPENFQIFKDTKLSAVKKIEFPFADDPEEFYTLKLNDKELVVDQFNGEVLSEINYSTTTFLEELSLDLHTGRTNVVWAIILGIACLNILFFIYSGFAITLKRRSTKIKNKYKSNEAEFILLVGTENGTTLHFADAIYQQLITQGKRAYLAQLNQYQVFENATDLLIFTSTYGLGDPPVNADKVLKRIDQYPQQRQIQFSVVGFGSHAYPDFCAFAKEVDEKLSSQDWAVRSTRLHTVDDKSPIQFAKWAKAWSEKRQVELATTPALYAKKPKGLQKMIVLDRTEVSETEQTFMLTVHTPTRTKFTSGDLLAIYPENDHRERLYSVAKCDENIQLIIKLHPDGLGSAYLNRLKVGSVFKARTVRNTTFHFPKNKAVIMIGNGTGIAPFLGMIAQNTAKESISLYLGFSKETEIVRQHETFLAAQLENQKLKNYQIAFSRAQNRCYVMDLIRQDSKTIAQQLKDGTTIMICGSLQMQLDVEETLNHICATINGNTLVFYKERGQILTDCY